MSASVGVSAMRVSVVVLTALVAFPLLAPSATADTASLETRHANGTVGSAFEDGETVVFRVRVRVAQDGPVAHRIYLYQGVGASATFVGLLDEGRTSQASRYFDVVFDIAWAQTLGGARVPAGQYTAQFRAPDGTSVNARLDLDWGPNMVLPLFRVDTTQTAGLVSPEMTAAGCVRNDGVQPVTSTRLTLAFQDQTTGRWTTSPVTSDVTLRDPSTCPSSTHRGTPFAVSFIAPPRTMAVRATFDVPGTVEQAPGDESRTVTVRWAL